MNKRTYKLIELTEPISVSIQNPQESPYNRFVGLEHYDSGEPVVTRFSDTSLLTSSVKEFKKNDILIARRNVYLKRAGIVFFDGLTSGDSIILRVRNDLDSKLGISRGDVINILPFELNSDRFWKFANKHADGMNSKRISKDTLLDYEFKLPSLEGQRIIANKLWAAYHLKESYKKLLAATDDMVKSQFIEMFGNCNNKVALSTFASYSIGLTYKPEDVCEEGIIVLRSGNIQESSLDLTDIVRVKTNIKDSLYIKDGDILMCSRNGSASLVGKVARIVNICEPMTYGAFMTVIKSAHSNYLFGFFQTDDFRKQISHGKSSTMNQITQKMLDSIVVSKPSEEAEKRFSCILVQADKSKFELRKSIEAIDNVIKSLINS